MFWGRCDPIKPASATGLIRHLPKRSLKSSKPVKRRREVTVAEIVRQLDGITPACICGDRFRHAEFIEAMDKAGLSRVPFIWRGFGWQDGSEDVERFRRAVFDGEVKAVPSLLRSAFSDAITVIGLERQPQAGEGAFSGAHRRGFGNAVGCGARRADEGRAREESEGSMGIIPLHSHRNYSKPVTRTRRWQVLRQQVLEQDG